MLTPDPCPARRPWTLREDCCVLTPAPGAPGAPLTIRGLLEFVADGLEVLQGSQVGGSRLQQDVLLGRHLLQQEPEVGLDLFIGLQGLLR